MVYETIMVNCNPETVSTDYDTSDRLYFEPITLKMYLKSYVLKSLKALSFSTVVKLLKLARALEEAGAPIIGTSPDAIDRAEDRERFQQMIQRLQLRQPNNSIVKSAEEGMAEASKVGYPLVVRPSYVLVVVQWKSYTTTMNLNATYVMRYKHQMKRLFFLTVSDDAIEVDVDCVSDGKDVVIGGIMQHIEQAGIHSGDSACSIPPYSLSRNSR
jgi:carbamoyl-phosphate synthase large subunit